MQKPVNKININNRSREKHTQNLKYKSKIIKTQNQSNIHQFFTCLFLMTEIVLVEGATLKETTCP